MAVTYLLGLQPEGAGLIYTCVGTLETEAESGASTKEVHTAAGRKQGGLHGVKYVS